ncbi:MAG: DUF885 domain-containing protein [Woeseiaceae bacterium]
MTIRVLSTAAILVIAGHATADPSDLYDDYWNFELRHDPFLATAAGDYRFNDRVPDVSNEAQRARLEQLRHFESRLPAATGDALNADILGFILKHEIVLGEFEPWRIPFLSDAGFHMNIGYVVSSTRFESADDYRDYLLRLRALPAYIEQNTRNMQAGLDAGFTQPRAIMANILPSFESQVTPSAAEHPLYGPFREMPDALSAEAQAELRREAQAVLEDDVIPAYAGLRDFMRDRYIPNARQSLGASDLPDGKQYYAALVRYFTTLDSATPETVHERGLAEVARIRAEMDAVIAETKFQGSFEEFLEFLRTDPQFYAGTAEELLKQAAWIAKKTDGRLPAFFGKLPRQPYSVEPVPDEIAPNYTGGRYVPSPPGGPRGGQYWVNTYALETRPLYQLVALSLHEGVPGHHLQGALAYEIEDAPAFRQQFYPHAFGEGWGLYSEKLGVEMGIYETPYDHFGRLSYEMWRACRLVVDTGIHAMGWSRERAVDYLASNTALSMHEVGTEIDRYIAWPAQALAYKTGELTIWELRGEAEQALGDAFDIRDFHDAILTSGGVPLEILKIQVRRYIDTTLADQQAALEIDNP